MISYTIFCYYILFYLKINNCKTSLMIRQHVDTHVSKYLISGYFLGEDFWERMTIMYINLKLTDNK